MNCGCFRDHASAVVPGCIVPCSFSANDVLIPNASLSAGPKKAVSPVSPCNVFQRAGKGTTAAQMAAYNSCVFRCPPSGARGSNAVYAQYARACQCLLVGSHANENRCLTCVSLRVGRDLSQFQSVLQFVNWGPRAGASWCSSSTGSSMTILAPSNKARLLVLAQRYAATDYTCRLSLSLHRNPGIPVMPYGWHAAPRLRLIVITDGAGRGGDAEEAARQLRNNHKRRVAEHQSGRRRDGRVFTHGVSGDGGAALPAVGRRLLQQPRGAPARPAPNLHSTPK